MKLELNQREIEAIILDCFCNGGVSELWSSGVYYTYNKKEYEKFAVAGYSYEDNLISLLKGGGEIEFIDEEGGGDTVSLTMELATSRLKNITDEVVIQSVRNMDENDYQADAWDGYNVIQYILYGEIIFG